MFQKILLASDGSNDALRAAQAAALLASKLGAALTVLHVYPEPMDFPPGVAGSHFYPDPAARDQEILAAWAAVARRIAAALEEQGVACTTREGKGHPAELIVNAAREEQAEMIVVTCQQMSGIKALLHGSVSDRVCHQAPCSVLVVK